MFKHNIKKLSFLLCYLFLHPASSLILQSCYFSGCFSLICSWQCWAIEVASIYHHCHQYAQFDSYQATIHPSNEQVSGAVGRPSWLKIIQLPICWGTKPKHSWPYMECGKHSPFRTLSIEIMYDFYGLQRCRTGHSKSSQESLFPSGLGYKKHDGSSICESTLHTHSM